MHFFLARGASFARLAAGMGVGSPKGVEGFWRRSWWWRRLLLWRVGPRLRPMKAIAWLLITHSLSCAAVATPSFWGLLDCCCSAMILRGSGGELRDDR